MQELLKSEVDLSIARALEMTKEKKEAGICRYLPGLEDGHMHHFTFKRLKQNDPKALVSLIKENILEKTSLQKLAPKQRAPHGSRRRLGMTQLSPEDMKRLLQFAMKEGDAELIKKLAPKPSLKMAKRELIRSIQKGEADVSLWNNYVTHINSKKK